MESCGNSAMRAHSGCSLYIIVLGASSYSSSKSDTELHIYFKIGVLSLRATILHSSPSFVRSISIITGLMKSVSISLGNQAL